MKSELSNVVDAEAAIRALEARFTTAFNAGDDGKLGFSHSIQHVTGTDTQGRPVDRTVRVTDGYRKVGGDWLIALEHVSVPVDLATGKPDVHSKP
jgi:hypothetical protein